MKETKKIFLEEIYNKFKNEDYSFEDFKKSFEPKRTVAKKEDYKIGGKYYYYKKKPDFETGNIIWLLYNDEKFVGEFKVREVVFKIKEIFDIDIISTDIFKVASKFIAKSKNKQLKLKEEYKGMKIMKKSFGN